MRGCLFVVVLGTAVLAAVAWFGSPLIAATAIRIGLDGSGYRAGSTTITATAVPPPRLLLGRADTIVVSGTNVDWRTLHAARLRLTLEDVDLFGRTVGAVHGALDAAELTGMSTTSSPVVALVTFDGPASAAETVITVPTADVSSLVANTIATEFGAAISDVQLAPPATLRLVTPGATVEGTLVIQDGQVVFSNRIGSFPMLVIDPSIPIELRSVSVVAGGLRIEGTLDVVALLRG